MNETYTISSVVRCNTTLGEKWVRHPAPPDFGDSAAALSPLFQSCFIQVLVSSSHVYVPTPPSRYFPSKP